MAKASATKKTATKKATKPVKPAKTEVKAKAKADTKKLAGGKTVKTARKVAKPEVEEEPVRKEFTERSKGAESITLHHRKLSKAEIEEMRRMLLDRRRMLLGDMKELEEEAFSDETKQVSTNHIADNSSEQYEQEFNLAQMENVADELREINRALDKIESGTYGICEATGEYISIERLRAMPYTRITVDARRRFEEEGGGEEFGVYPERRV